MTEQLAIDGGAPTRTAPYPAWPQWDQDEAENLIKVLNSGEWWAPGGSHVTRFEEAFARYHEAEHGVAVTNGSAALEVCLRAARIDWGDEVITTPYTFIATANSCLLVGAIPRFADLLPDTWNLDPACVEALITPRTKAIMPVHLGGEPADMDAIMDIARRHNLIVIEDACQAHGATWKGRKVGAIGDMGCFSFQASKNITGGEGGMILTRSESWAEKCWSVTNVGRQRHGAFYQHIGLASNYRLSEWAGAVLSAQLTRMEAQTARRAENAAYLAELLSEVEGIAPVRGDARTTLNAYHLFKAMYDPEAFGGRSASDFAAAMRAEGVPVSTGYPLSLAEHEVVTRRIDFIRAKLGLPVEPRDDCPVCREVCANGLWLPQYTLLSERADLDDVAVAARKIATAWR